MILDVCVKEGNNYKLCKVNPPAGSDFSFFKSLRLTIEEQLDIIRKDIQQISPNGEVINLINPKVEDEEIQLSLNNLVEFRSINMKTKEVINNVLKGTEFIICERCGGKMFKSPLNIAYSKIGNSVILDTEHAHQNVEYTFTCESCPYFIHEQVYHWQQGLKKLRENLLAEGDGFVPDNLGFWHQETPKIEEQQEEECRHVFKRLVEEYEVEIDGQPRTIIKIEDKCVYCGHIDYHK